MDRIVKATDPCGACGKPVGTLPWRHKDKPNVNFCSRACLEIAIQRGAFKRKQNMEVPLNDFGEAGIVRHHCDNCSKPCPLVWQGSRGIYCSNKCLEASENETLENKQMETTETTSTEAPVSNPITAGSTAAKPKSRKAKKLVSAVDGKGKVKAAAKKSGKNVKAAAKAPKGKTAKAGPHKGGGKALFNPEAVIKHTADFDINKYRGARIDQAKAIKNGMTVEAYYKAHAAAKVANPHINDSPGSFLTMAIAAKLITAGK